MDWQYLFCYITVDVACALVATILTQMVRSDSGNEIQLRYFRALIASYFVFVIADAAWATFIIGHFIPMDHPLVLGLNAITRFAAAAAGYFWFCFGELHLGRTFLYRSRARLISLVPMILALVLYLVGLPFGSTFVQMDDGSLGNGPLYAVITAVALLYLIIVTVDSFVHAMHAKLRAQRRRYLIFASFMIAPMVAAIIDIAVPNMPVMAPAMLVSIMLVVRELQDSRISTDALTGLNNRRRADAYLEEKLVHANGEDRLSLFIVDMDRFKSINDTYGHLEGDRALKTMADALREAASDHDAFVARWGGDEFVMICDVETAEDARRVVESIRTRLAEQVQAHDLEYTLSCSVGYAICSDSATDMRTLMQDADKLLFVDKQRFSQQPAQKAAETRDLA